MYKGQFFFQRKSVSNEHLLTGINLISELALLDTPSAICPFYAEQKAGGGSERIPSIAVACGQVGNGESVRPLIDLIAVYLHIQEVEAKFQVCSTSSSSERRRTQRLGGNQSLQERGCL